MPQLSYFESDLPLLPGIHIPSTERARPRRANGFALGDLDDDDALDTSAARPGAPNVVYFARG